MTVAPTPTLKRVSLVTLTGSKSHGAQLCTLNRCVPLRNRLTGVPSANSNDTSTVSMFITSHLRRGGLTRSTGSSEYSTSTSESAVARWVESR